MDVLQNLNVDPKLILVNIIGFVILLVVAKKIVLKMDKSIVSVSPNSYWAKEIAVPLKVGTYVLRANLNKQGGSLVSEEIFVQLKK
jgi:hypothetical protein